MDFSCAECGTTTATTYVVTTLDRENPRDTRTEVCLDCHQGIEGFPHGSCSACGEPLAASDVGEHRSCG